jgi:hypothetical protein
MIAVVKGIRSTPITIASILCLLIGVVTLIVGFVLFGVAAGLAGWTLPPDTWEIIQVIFNLIISFGFSFSIVAGLLFVGVAILHLLGWYWLWGTRVRGGVFGIIAGTADVTAVIIGMVLLIVFSFLAVPLLVAILTGFLLLGIILLAMIAIGWKTLKYRIVS